MQRNAVAIYLWRDRIIKFLEHMTEKQTIKKGESGGKTRDYLLFMLKQESVSDALASLAIYHLSVYMPVCGAITHTDDVFDMAGIAKTVYTKLLEAGKKPETLADGTFFYV